MRARDLPGRIFRPGLAWTREPDAGLTTGLILLAILIVTGLVSVHLLTT